MLDNLPPAGWGAVLGAAITALGMMVLGLIRARTDSKKIDSTDRNDLQRQLTEFARSLQAQLQQEREHCEHRLDHQERVNAERLAARDQVIARLTERIEHLESRL